MKYTVNVIHNGKLYPAGTEVPVGEQVNVELTDDVPEGALDDNADGSVNIYDQNGNVAGTASAEEVEQLREQAGEAFEEQEKPKRGRKPKSD